MAFESLHKVKIVPQQAQKARSLVSRYYRCDLVIDGSVQRLAFKRYAEYDMKTRSAHRTLGVINPGSENRLDEVARQVYGDFRMYWAVFMFNRWLGTNPLRFPSQYVVAFPMTYYIQNQVSTRGVRDA